MIHFKSVRWKNFLSTGNDFIEIQLKYIPLLDWGYDFVVQIDDDLDGSYETELVRGNDLTRLKANEYFLNLESR